MRNLFPRGKQIGETAKSRYKTGRAEGSIQTRKKGGVKKKSRRLQEKARSFTCRQGIREQEKRSEKTADQQNLTWGRNAQKSVFSSERRGTGEGRANRNATNSEKQKF